MSQLILTHIRLSKSLFLGLSVLGLTAGQAQAAPKVVASIKPVHSLVAAVMDGVGSPDLVVDGAGSPHAYAMRPSQAATLQDADLVFWVGPSLESFLVKPVETLGDGKSVTLMDADADDDHAGEHGDGHDHVAHEEEGAEDEDGHHHHEGADPHIWLDPVEAGEMVHRIEEALAEADPENAAAYEANAEKLETRLTELTGEIETTVAPVKDTPFVVFHDAYEHFSERFGIEPEASVTLSPDRTPSAAHIAEVQGILQETQAACIFAEPQFEPKLVDVLIEGTSTRKAVLDPLGADLTDGPDLYFELMRNLAGSLRDCLGGES
ncbi:zinc ABC transporter substrate-binding protein [Fulvimarina sp. MAC8]|uniref:zinc ABC transporter substrate-binding protein n=1 Tax=Fulvimarina sp. MAC8 TaxID=3162874 RepID=UPI0032EB4ABC